MNKRIQKKQGLIPPIVKAEKPAKNSWFKAIAIDKQMNMSIDWALKKPSNISFKELREIALRNSIIRICINVIKKAVSQSKWQIKVKDRYRKDRKRRTRTSPRIYKRLWLCFRAWR